MESIWTMASAAEWAAAGKLEAWIHGYLTGEGNNQALSDGLKKAKRRYFGPIVFPLRSLERCTGPEESMKYREESRSFEPRIQKIEQAIQQGFDLPPLIVNYSSGRFELNDGNHRHEALIRSQIEHFGVIIWTTGKADFEAFKARTFDFSL